MTDPAAGATRPTLLLDTNMLSREKFEENSAWDGSTLVTASTSAQEVLGMQRPDRQVGYRYALPVLDARLGVRAIAFPDQYRRWLADHAKQMPVSRQTDTLTVPRSRLRQESREQGHVAVAIAHEVGDDRLFEAYAKSALRPKQYRPVLSKWQLLRSEVAAVIPLDVVIAERAVELANRFIDTGQYVRSGARNTMNDMYVAATSSVMGIPLVTDDVQLKAFYQDEGWTVSVGDDSYIASPDPLPTSESSASVKSERRDRYVNRPAQLRGPIDQTPPKGA